jgi:hypothetical protein
MASPTPVASSYRYCSSNMCCALAYSSSDSSWYYPPVLALLLKSSNHGTSINLLPYYYIKDIYDYKTHKMIIPENASPCREMSMQGIHSPRDWTMHRMGLGLVSWVNKVTACDSPTTADAGADFVTDSQRDPRSMDLSAIERNAAV